MTRLLLLSGLALLVLPPVLHWWTRVRPRRLRWAAWRFLPRPDPETRRRRQLDEPGLLALRLFGWLLLVLAAAGPTCQRPLDAGGQLAALDRPLVLVDLSARMGLGPAGNRPLDRAASALRRLFEEGQAGHAGLWGCAGNRPLRLLEAGELAQAGLASRFEQALRADGSELMDCVATLPAEAPSLVIVSDREPPDELPRNHADLAWLGVGDLRPPANAAIGNLRAEGDGEVFRIDGTVVGDRPVDTVRLEWREPARPPLDLPVDAEGRFGVDLLAPAAVGRLVVRIPGRDAFAGDDAVPLWVPRAETPRVYTWGPLSDRVEHRMLDLWYAIGDRVRLADEQVFEPGGRRLHLIADGRSLSTELVERIRAAVEAGATAVLLPQAAEDWVPALSRLAPGWLYASQPAAEAGIRPAPALSGRWPELAALPWDSVELRRIHPLAEPVPTAEVLLETAGGLPLLVREPRGAGEVYTWLVGPAPADGNLAASAVWAPLWLGILQLLDERIGQARLVVGTPQENLDAVRLERVLWDHGSPSQWIGWARARDRSGRPLLVASRFAPDQVQVGAATGLRMLEQSGAAARTTAATVPEDVTRTWLAVAVAAWLLHLVFGAWRSRRLGVAGLVLLTIWTAAPAQAEGRRSLDIWVPEESRPTAGQLAGLAEANRDVMRRTSLALETQARRFSWAVSDPAGPLVWWLGCREPDPAADDQLADALERFLRRRGTLWVEACGGRREAEQLAARLDGWLQRRGLGEGLRELDAEHVLYRSFFLLDEWRDAGGVGAVWAAPIWELDRVFVVPNLGRALALSADGTTSLPIPAVMQEWIRRQYVNLWFYATTYDYKNDAIHLPYILQRRQRRR